MSFNTTELNKLHQFKNIIGKYIQEYQFNQFKNINIIGKLNDFFVWTIQPNSNQIIKISFELLNETMTIVYPKYFVFNTEYFKWCIFKMQYYDSNWMDILNWFVYVRSSTLFLMKNSNHNLLKSTPFTETGESLR